MSPKHFIASRRRFHSPKLGPWLAAIVFAATLASTAEAQRNRNKASLRIGTVVPQTGALGIYGTELVNGMQLAIEWIARDNRDLADRLQLVVRDDESSTAKTEELTRELIASRQADVLFGSVSSTATLAMAKAMEKTDRPLVTPTATHASITRVGANIFRTCFADAYQGEALARFALNDLRKNRAAILFEETSEYSKTISDSFEKTYRNLGGQLLAKISYRTGMKDFTAVIKKLKRKRPQVVLVPGYYQEAGSIIKQARQLGLGAILLGTDGWDSPALTKIAGRGAIPGHYFATHFSVEDPEETVQQFVTAYRTRYRKDPSTISAMGFDGLLVLADAFRRANSSLPRSMTRALSVSKKQVVQTMMGAMLFDNQRNAHKSVPIMATYSSGPKFFARVKPEPK